MLHKFKLKILDLVVVLGLMLCQHELALKMPQLELVYGRLPPTLLSYVPRTTKLEAVDQKLVFHVPLSEKGSSQRYISNNSTKCES